MISLKINHCLCSSTVPNYTQGLSYASKRHCFYCPQHCRISPWSLPEAGARECDPFGDQQWYGGCFLRGEWIAGDHPYRLGVPCSFPIVADYQKIGVVAIDPVRARHRLTKTSGADGVITPTDLPALFQISGIPLSLLFAFTSRSFIRGLTSGTIKM